MDEYETFPEISKIYLIAPFNSKLVVDNSCLAEKYDLFRKHLYMELQDDCACGDHLLIEKFQNLADPSKAIENWCLDVVPEDQKNPQKAKKTKRKKRKQLIFKSGVGETKKDSSIIALTPKLHMKFPKSITKHDILAKDPEIRIDLISIHEYGVGILWAEMFLEFTPNILNIPTMGPKELITDLAQNILQSDQLCNYLTESDDLIGQESQKVFKQLNIKPAIFSYDALYKDQPSGRPLWSHVVFNHDDEDTTLKDWIMSKIVEVSHENGSIDYIKGRSGFVHTGWQNSAWIGILKQEFNFVFEALRYSEIKWRQLQILGDILYSEVNRFANIETFNRQQIQEKLTWINDIRIEMELYTADHQNIIQNMAPVTYLIYMQTKVAWRISDMENFFDEKLDTFEILNEKGRDDLEAENDKRVNNILFIFTAISLFATIADIIAFLDPDNELIPKENIVLRLLFILLGPTTLMVLISLLFRMRKRR